MHSIVNAIHRLYREVDFFLYIHARCKKCGEAWQKNCDDVEAVTKFSCLGDRMNATGGCETTVTAKQELGR